MALTIIGNTEVFCCAPLSAIHLDGTSVAERHLFQRISSEELINIFRACYVQKEQVVTYAAWLDIAKQYSVSLEAINALWSVCNIMLGGRPDAPAAQLPTPSFVLYLYLQQFDVNAATTSQYNVGWPSTTEAQDGRPPNGSAQFAIAIAGWLKKNLSNNVMMDGSVLNNLEWLVLCETKLSNLLPMISQTGKATVKEVAAFLSPCIDTFTFDVTKSLAHKDPQCTLSSNVFNFEKIRSLTCIRSDSNFPKSSPPPGICLWTGYSSFIYLLTPMRYLYIKDLKNSTVFAGAVSRCIVLDQCEGVVVVAACGCTIIKNSNTCTVRTYCATRPILSGSTHNITLAPYGAQYHCLGRHLSSAGLVISSDQWDSPVCCTYLGGDAFNVMNPDDYGVFIIPCEMDGDGSGGSYVMPMRYADAINRRRMIFKNTQKMMTTAGQTQPIPASVGDHIQQQFQEWLTATGQARHIAELKKMCI